MRLNQHECDPYSKLVLSSSFVKVCLKHEMLAYSTIRTLVSLLEDKDLVKRLPSEVVEENKQALNAALVKLQPLEKKSLVPSSEQAYNTIQREAKRDTDGTDQHIEQTDEE